MLNTTSDVGSVTRGQGSRVAKCCPSVVRSMFRHFARLFHFTRALQWHPRGHVLAGGRGALWGLCDDELRMMKWAAWVPRKGRSGDW